MSSSTSSSKISTSSLPVASLGTPRIGPRRELKFALESFWSGTSDEKSLIEAGAGLRAANWARQKKLGVSIIPSNDFSFYDQVLDTSAMVGAIPEIYGWNGGPVPLAVYFAMARGAQGEAQDADCGHAHHGHAAAQGVPALEMTKWFDTNYHYMVPELTKDQRFSLASRKPIEEYEEAKALGYQTRPVLVGPVTFLKLAKSKDAGFNPLSLLDRLLPVYIEVLRELAYRGAEWVQIDEPCLVLDLDIVAQQAVHFAYAQIAAAVPQLKIMLATYFGGLGSNRDTALALPVAGLHLDLARAPEQLDGLADFPGDRVLSLGVIDGRNIWRADLSRVLDRLEPVVAKLGKDRVQIALAIRDEVADLEAAGAGMIQIDEAALREGLPLRKSEWKAYLDWAVDAFRLCSSGVRDETQIHTHMCYSEFNDIINAIGAMDADVISIETSRSKMKLLDAFRDYRYPNEIGPGVYDIHSPRVPEIGEMTGLLKLARMRLSDAQIWINPDCGLKTRKWEEVRPALVNMVAAARELRASA
jgi:methionine synthase II (cobalamin-independent)